MMNAHDRKRQEREARRHRIQDAARPVFFERGFARASIEDIAKQAQAEGVRDLRQSGLVKVRAGVTSLEEVILVTNE